MVTGEKLSTSKGQQNVVEAHTERRGWRKLLGVKAGALAAAGAILFSGCGDSAAETASKNMSTAADNFEVPRRIIFVNGITDEIPFVVEGRCSIEVDHEDKQLEVMCKEGPDEYKKHFLGISDNMTYIVEQLEPVDVDEYRTRIMIKPEQLVPNFDLNVSSGN